MTEALTPASVRADIAQMLYLLPDELPDDCELFESGLDSLRLMTLIEKWRAAGSSVSFVDLAERATPRRRMDRAMSPMTPTVAVE